MKTHQGLRARTAAVLVALIALPSMAQAQGNPGSLFVIVSTVSYHTRAHDQLNGVNPGAGLGISLNRHVDVIAGSFRNSYSETSRYAMARMRLTGYGAAAIHLSGGYLDGYEQYAGPKRIGLALDAQYGPVTVVAAPDPFNDGYVLSLWFIFDGVRDLLD
jgi:hypothetical protein